MSIADYMSGTLPYLDYYHASLQRDASGADLELDADDMHNSHSQSQSQSPSLSASMFGKPVPRLNIVQDGDFRLGVADLPSTKNNQSSTAAAAKQRKRLNMSVGDGLEGYAFGASFLSLVRILLFCLHSLSRSLFVEWID
jgi:hypothetical protein